MERCANTEALNKMLCEEEKAEKLLEHEQNELYNAINIHIDSINREMKYFAIDSVMDKQDILEYVRDTIDSLLEIK